MMAMRFALHRIIYDHVGVTEGWRHAHALGYVHGVLNYFSGDGHGTCLTNSAITRQPIQLTLLCCRHMQHCQAVEMSLIAAESALKTLVLASKGTRFSALKRLLQKRLGKKKVALWEAPR